MSIGNATCGLWASIQGGEIPNVAQIFGVTEQSQALVEGLYLEYLEALNAHFEHYADRQLGRVENLEVWLA